MLFLTELSVLKTAIIETVLNTDPLVAKDRDYSIKTWMADKENLACRPWRVFASPRKNMVRILGWRTAEAISNDPQVYVGTQHFQVETGQSITLQGQFVALRRVKGKSFDPGKKYHEEPRKAYTAWLRERLIDVMPFADIIDCTVNDFSHKVVTRKIHAKAAPDRVNPQIGNLFASRTKSVNQETIPVVKATITIKPTNAAAVEEWLHKGVGPQKAFGYGGFFPVADLADGETNEV